MLDTGIQQNCIRSAGWQNEIDKNIGINGQCLTLASSPFAQKTL
ncbi:MAG: hypothetical protein ACR5LA_10155 [Wolbachia sp.]